jgi:6-hydroxytryprostatin B O-methyltransferase
VAHSHLSAAFIAQPAFQDWARFMTRYSAPTAQHFADATARWGDTQASNQTAYNIAFNTELPFFQHVAELKERTEMFGKYMRSLGQSEALAPRHVLDSFNWEGLGKAHVVDVSLSFFSLFALVPIHYDHRDTQCCSRRPI